MEAAARACAPRIARAATARLADRAAGAKVKTAAIRLTRETAAALPGSLESSLQTLVTALATVLAPNGGPAPGELPEGVIGPIRRARMERKKREAEERANAPPVVVDLSGRRASGGGASGGAVTVTVDLVTGEETRSGAGSPATKRNRSRRSSGAAPAGGSDAVVVDLT